MHRFSKTRSVTRASKHKRESPNNRTPEENAGKTQYTACVRHCENPSVLLPHEEKGSAMLRSSSRIVSHTPEQQVK